MNTETVSNTGIHYGYACYFDTFDNATCVMQVMAKKNEFTEDIYIKMNVSSSLTPPGPFSLQFFFPVWCCHLRYDRMLTVSMNST